MYRWRLFVFLSIVLGMLMGSHGCGCNDDDMPVPEDAGMFELAFVPTASGQSLDNNVPVTNVQGRPFYTEEFLMYVSDIVLVKENGEELLLAETKLYDLGNGDEAKKTSHGDGAYATFVGPEVLGTFRGVKFAVGVPARRNHQDPTSLPPENPLNASYGMHWNAQDGYQFISLEGRIDDSPNMDGQNYDTHFSYHLGTDALYQPLSFTESQHAFSIQAGEELQFVIEVDVNRLFFSATDTIDMVTQNLTESQNSPEIPNGFDLSQQMMDNLVKGALFKRPF